MCMSTRKATDMYTISLLQLIVNSNPGLKRCRKYYFLPMPSIIFSFHLLIAMVTQLLSFLVVLFLSMLHLALYIVYFRLRYSDRLIHISKITLL